MPITRHTRFEQSVMPHLDAAYNLARWLTRNDHDADDVVQEAFVRAFRFIDGLREADARPWLLTIVRNTAYSWMEKNRPADLVPIEDPAVFEAPAESNPEVVVLQSASRRLVNQSLEELPVALREVLVMRELEDLSYKEIARIAAIPIGTVMSRLARGRAALRTAIETRMKKAC